jgi:hypothetical protein
MYLLKHISLSFFILFVVFGLNSYGQADSTFKVQSPYRSEYNPWFKFSKFKRGFHNDSLKIALDTLEKTPRKKWLREDSLNFAQLSLKTGNYELSQYYYHSLNVSFNSEEEYWWDQLVIYYLQEEFQKGTELIYKDHPGILEFSEIYFIEQIFLAKIADKKDPKWHKSNAVLNWTPDSSFATMDKSNPAYQTGIIEPIENINKILQLLIHYVHDSDQIIARVCLELGQILETNVSWTQAYIAYSLGRNYNKRDKDILAHVKLVKAKLVESKYKIPIFRRYFPRTEYWRFEYELLKERIVHQKNDTIVKEEPILMLPVKETPLPFKPTWIILGGILITFVLILFLVKTKK